MVVATQRRAAVVELSVSQRGSTGDAAIVNLGAFRVEIDASATVLDWCRAVERLDLVAAVSSDGHPIRWQGAVVGTGSASETLVPESRLWNLALAHGDPVQLLWSDAAEEELRPVEAEADRRSASPSHWFLGHPSRGDLRCPDTLGRGTYRIGRDRTCNEIVLSDPTVSRRHATLVIDDDVSIRDDRSTHGTYVGVGVGDRVDASTQTRVDPGSSLRLGEVEVTVVPVFGDGRAPSPGTAGGTAAEPDGRFGAPVVINRPPRMLEPLAEVAIAAPPPPTPVPQPRLAWVSALTPLVVGLVMILVMRAVSGGGTYLVMSGVFFLMSPLMLFGGWVESRRSARRERRERMERFERSFEAATQAADDALVREAALLEQRFPSTAALEVRAVRRTSELWDGAADDAAAPCRIGTGTVPTLLNVELPADLRFAETAEELRGRYGSFRRRYEYHLDAPVTVEMQRCRAVAVVGDDATTTALATSMVLQSATRLPPSRLSTAVLTTQPRATRWRWLTWLRSNAPSTWWAGSILAVADEREALLAELEELAAAGVPGATDEVERLVVVDADALGASDLARLLRVAASGVCRIVWIGERRGDAPGASEVVVVCEAADSEAADSEAAFGVVNVVEGAQQIAVRLDTVSPRRAARWARALAPLVEALPAATSAGALPRAVGLDEVFDTAVFGSTDAVAERWRTCGGRLRTPIGRRGEEVVWFDLERDGPHGLIAGTTGSGKSQLLQSIVVGLAASVSPEDLSMLFIDFKGGAAFADCTALPHCVGMVTDLDGHLADRVLRSLAAEIRRRERLLAAHGASDLAGYRQRPGIDALARLVIVIDEFASIAAEIDGFVDAMVDIGRRGRSLGIHLLLATQRPAGVVTEHLRANVNLRIALRMADPHESENVIGIAAAATIPRSTPGRAVMRAGQGAVVLFQAASVALIDSACGDRPHPVELAAALQVGSHGAAVPVDSTGPDALVSAVDTVRSAAIRGGFDAPRRPWLEPVEPTLTLESLLGAHDVADAEDSVDGRPDVDVSAAPAVRLGIADEPDHQRQRVATFALDGTSLGAFGADMGSLGALVEALVLSAGHGDANGAVRFDVVDGGAALGRVEHLANVGSVIDATDTERIERLLGELLARRGGTDRSGSAAHRVIVVHHLGAVLASMGRHGQRFVQSLDALMVDGRAAGVTVVLTCDRRRSMPYELFGALGARFVFAMADDAEYALVSPGAGVVHRAAGPLGWFEGATVQVPRRCGDAQFLELVDRHGLRGDAHPAVGRLAQHCALSDLEVDPMAAPWSWPIGIADATLKAATVDLQATNLLVAGPVRSGKTTALATIVHSAKHAGCHTASDPVRVIVVAGRGEPDGALRAQDLDVVVAGDDIDAIAALGPTLIDTTDAVVVVVDDAHELCDAAARALDGIVGDLRRSSVRFVVACDSVAARSAFAPLVTRIRRERHCVLVRPESELDGDVAGVRLGRFGRYAVPGRAELVRDGEASLVQIAMPW